MRTCGECRHFARSWGYCLAPLPMWAYSYRHSIQPDANADECEAYIGATQKHARRGAMAECLEEEDVVSWGYSEAIWSWLYRVYYWRSGTPKRRMIFYALVFKDAARQTEFFERPDIPDSRFRRMSDEMD